MKPNFRKTPTKENKILLIDLNQVVIANLMQQLGPKAKSVKLDEKLLRHMILNTLRSYVKQFKQSYGEIVICCDSSTYWRREVFPLYKANRKKDRDSSGLDWKLIFDVLHKIRAELKEYFPYKVVEVLGAEADDIIAVLAEYGVGQDTLILSSDKDFVQLQRFPGVSQYSPILKKFIRTDNPDRHIKEHIIRGDSGDGVPNFLSSDNCLVIGERQKSISTIKLKAWLELDEASICINDDLKRGYARNKMLVDFSQIPTQLKENILAEYKSAPVSGKKKLFDYFIDQRLTKLISVIDEF